MSQSAFWTDLNAFLRDYYNEPERRKIIEFMKRDASEMVERLSLDDIERIANRRLGQAESC